MSATTLVSGQITFSNVPAGSGYTLSATKSGATTTLSSQTFTTSPTTSVGIALPTGTIAVNAATWAGRPAGSATVTVSGGPMSPTTYTGTTNSSGVVSVVVPASSTAYTVTVTKAGATGTATVTSLAAGATATVTPTLTPTKTLTLTIQRGGTLQTGKAITLSITGGPNGVAGAAPAYGGAYTTHVTAGTIAIVLPAGAGTYRVKAYVTGCSGTTPKSNGNTGSSVSAAAGTTTAIINMTSSTCLPSLP